MEQLALAAALTTKTKNLCIGLEDGVANIFDCVTPTTVELLRWWFGEQATSSRKLNFHAGQKQAILNTIVAHEVLNATNFAPRIIVSGLMLREGFDVNNICVIVPLRSSQAQILLEQTIGHGLRLMWRDEEFSDSKRENRERIHNGQEPNNLIDVLSIVEHPAFQSFYDELMREGLVGTSTEASETNSSVGDLISVGLRENYQEFDFAIPFILREAEESLQHQAINIQGLTPFSAMTVTELKALLGKGDVFVSQDLQTNTLFGDYRVDGAY